VTQRITLEAWLALNFAPETAPNIDTVRRWAKCGKITPAPVKCGRAYYVEPTARYTGAPQDDFLERLRRDHAAHAATTVTH
jgi:hypothetical protein